MGDNTITLRYQIPITKELIVVCTLYKDIHYGHTSNVIGQSESSEFNSEFSVSITYNNVNIMHDHNAPTTPTMGGVMRTHTHTRAHTHGI